MRFDEQNKVIIDTMSRIEAKAFILFLKSEIARHQMDIEDVRVLIYDVCRKFHIADMVDE